jgi:hypothetical protein
VGASKKDKETNGDKLAVDLMRSTAVFDKIRSQMVSYSAHPIRTEDADSLTFVAVKYSRKKIAWQRCLDDEQVVCELAREE